MPQEIKPCAVLDMCKTGDNPTTLIAEGVRALYGGEHLVQGNNVRHDAIAVVQRSSVLFIMTGIVFYCHYRDLLDDIVRAAQATGAKIVCLENDYMLDVPNALRGKQRRGMFDLWTNCEASLVHAGDKLINWNAWSYAPLAPPGQSLPPPPRQLLYYGSCRPDRFPSFDRYFTAGEAPLLLATTKRAAKRFYERYWSVPNMRFQPRILLPDIRGHGVSLYIEDESTHTIYHHPATRFYEALSVRAPMLFDAACVGTFDRAGFNVRPWAVSSRQEADDMVLNADLAAMADEQWNAFTNGGKRDFAAETTAVVADAIAQLKQGE